MGMVKYGGNIKQEKLKIEEVLSRVKETQTIINIIAYKKRN